MSSESSSPNAAPAPPSSTWRRFLAWLAAFEAAMDTTYDDIQDRRILALEREIADIRSLMRPTSSAERP